MGVKEAPLHDLYPAYVTRTLREAILAFERRMPGFISPGKKKKKKKKKIKIKIKKKINKKIKKGN